MRYCHKTNSILLRIVLCDSFNTLFLGNAQDLFKFMGFSLLDFLKRRPCRPNFSNCFPFVFRSRFDFCQMPITCTRHVVPDSCVFFISQMGIRCFTPVSDGHKKTATVHSLLFSPNPTVCTTLIQVKSPSKDIE